MTIVVGVATPEGLVLASDSRTTTTFTEDETERHRIGSDNMQKIFAVGGMGVATFGWAFLDRDTVAGVMDEFAAQVAEEHAGDVHEFASALGAFFHERFTAALDAAGETWSADAGFALGFLLAGYDDEGVGHICEVLIPGPEINEEASVETREGGFLWRGQTDVLDRLMRGVDVAALAVQLEAEVPEDLVEALSNLRYIPMSPLTIQDGVDYAAFLVRTTIDMQRFTDGTVAAPGSVPACGGPIQLLAVERTEPTWVAALNLTRPSRPGAAEGSTP